MPRPSGDVVRSARTETASGHIRTTFLDTLAQTAGRQPSGLLDAEH